MSTKTKIEWTRGDDGTAGKTWNPVVGCTRVSSGCDSCYAVRQSYRMEAMHSKAYAGLTVLNAKGERHFNGTVRCLPGRLSDPLHWRKPCRVFVNSMSDLFHKNVPFVFIDQVFAVMMLCPQHTFQILTKRPERMAEYFSRYFDKPAAIAYRWGEEAALFLADAKEGHAFIANDGAMSNVWLGTSTEDQATADERIPHLLRCPGAVRFLSVEPMLGTVDLCLNTVDLLGTIEAIQCPRIDWVICGGESGPGARQCNVDWIRSIITQCKGAGVPCFVKQLGAKPITNPDVQGLVFAYTQLGPKGGDPSEWPEDLRVREYPKESDE